MAMSDNNFNQLDRLSDINFLKLVGTIYEHVSEIIFMIFFCVYECIQNINNSIFPDFDLDKKQEFIKEIFERLHSFDSNSINLCLKTFYLLTQERSEIDVRIFLFFSN